MVIDAATKLDDLAREELRKLTALFEGLEPYQCGIILVESCRCMDQIHLGRINRIDGEFDSGYPDFDILVRGWNVIISLLIARVEGLKGIPLLRSTKETRNAALSYLHFAGRYVILSRTSEMVRNGMVSAEEPSPSVIELRTTDKVNLDFFRDQIDHLRMDDMNGLRDRSIQTGESSEVHMRIRSIAASLTFPWDTPQGRMVGYTANPEMDEHFLRIANRQVIEWRDESGLHPASQLPGCSGATLTAVVAVLISFCMKHVVFVYEGSLVHSEINIPMSYTIWRKKDEIVIAVREVLVDVSQEEIEAAINIIKIGRESSDFLSAEHTPYVPLLVEISTGYLVSPISAALRNPFSGLIRLQSQLDPRFENAVRRERESWMVSDLYALFQGTRYTCVEGQTRLRRDGKDITDIDAAIYDQLSGDLVLFQLKWQDFGTSIVRSQKSRARNFTERVDDWGKRVCDWIDEFGVKELCGALRVRVDAENVRYVRLVAIGRSAARFRSLGYHVNKQVLAVSWAQLVRLRMEIGPFADIFEELMRRVAREENYTVHRNPIEYKMEFSGAQVVLKDIWSASIQATS